MSRPIGRLDRLAKRLAALDGVVNPPLGHILVAAPDAEHPHGTRVRRSLALTVYHAPAAGEPDLSEYGPGVMVIIANDPGPEHIDTPYPWEVPGWVDDEAGSPDDDPPPGEPA
jgi:hypothetical protein